MDSNLQKSDTNTIKAVQDVKQLDCYLKEADKEFETLYNRMNKLRTELNKSKDTKKN